MKKLFTLFVFLIFTTFQTIFPQTSSSQYTVKDSMVVYDVGTFEEGVDSAWNPGAGQYAPRYWTTTGAVYSYTPGRTGNVMATTDSTDNMNYWDVFGNSNGIVGYTGYADMDYQLYIPTSDKMFSDDWTSNYQNWNGYSNLQIKWRGWNFDSTKNVILEVLVYTQANGGQWIQISPQMNKAPNTTYIDSFSLGGLTSAQLSQISFIKFRVTNDLIVPGDANNCGSQRTYLYSIKLTNPVVPTSSSTIAVDDSDQTLTSHFLGTVFHRRYGSYSATGFYDTGMNNPGVFKIWFGGGMPEEPAADNVWYVQTPTLNPSVLKNNDLKCIRCTVTPINLWTQQYKGVNETWGDPSVIRIMTSWNPPACTYYMWVSAVAVGTNWNQIYRLVSSDGINWTINPTTPAVAAANGGVAGYGSGSPSVVIAKGYYWLWYYSQYESAGPGVYLQKCTDGVSWGPPTKLSSNVNSAIDAKYIDSLNEFVAVSDVEVHGGGVYTITSKDGINWNGAPPPYISQDTNAYLCHNPGLIGTDQGHGWPEMYMTYGASQEKIDPTEYYTRELEYSSLHISNKTASGKFLIPHKVTLPTGVTGWTSVAVGENHSLAIGNDGTLYAWGLNSSGQLGIGDTIQQVTPQKVNLPTGVTSWIGVTGGEDHSLALGSDGNLYAWGLNSSGQLGIDNTTNQVIPVKVFDVGASAQKLAPEFFSSSSYAIDANGTLYVWGNNQYGQLGLGTAMNDSTPVNVPFPSGVTSWAEAAGGGYHTLAIGNDGNLYSWGYNIYGELGLGNTTNQSTPQKVAFPTGVTGWRVVAAGAFHSLAIGNDGNVYECGYGISIGGSNQTTFQKVGLPSGVLSWTSIAAGSFNCFAIGSDGNLYGWGYNGYGQLGIGNTTNQSTPQKVAFPTGVTGWTSVVAGGGGLTTHTLVIGNDGNLYAWGSNNYGQLGIGDITSVKQENNQTPTNFVLSQNYPNPFNPTTEIKYSIPLSSIVTLKVYNLLGQEVVTLVNHEQNSGNYIVNFDASKLASGVYLYRIQAGYFSLTKKMILVK